MNSTSKIQNTRTWIAVFLTAFFLLNDHLYSATNSEIETVKDEMREVYNSVLRSLCDREAYWEDKRNYFQNLDQEIVNETYKDYSTLATALFSISGEPREDMKRHKLLELCVQNSRIAQANQINQRSVLDYITTFATNTDFESFFKENITQLSAKITQRQSRSDFPIAIPCIMQDYLPYQKGIAQNAIDQWADHGSVLKMMSRILKKETVAGLFKPFEGDPVFGGYFTVLHAYCLGGVDDSPLPDHWMYRLHQQNVNRANQNITQLKKTRESFKNGKNGKTNFDLIRQYSQQIKNEEDVLKRNEDLLIKMHELKYIEDKATQFLLELDMASAALDASSSMEGLVAQKKKKKKKKNPTATLGGMEQQEIDGEESVVGMLGSSGKEPQTLDEEHSDVPSVSLTETLAETLLLNPKVKEVDVGLCVASSSSIRKDSIQGDHETSVTLETDEQDLLDLEPWKLFQDKSLPSDKPHAQVAEVSSLGKASYFHGIKKGVKELWDVFHARNRMEWKDFRTLMAGLGCSIHPSGGSARKIFYPTRGNTGRGYFVVHEPHGHYTTLENFSLVYIRKVLLDDLGLHAESFRD